MTHLISTRLIRYDRYGRAAATVGGSDAAAAATLGGGDAAAATIGGGDVFHFICNFYILNIVM